MLIYRASLLDCKEEGIENVINWFHNRLKKGFTYEAHIFCAGDSLDEDTTRMRIGSGLLEKVEMKTGGKDLKIILFNNFVNNVWSLYRQKMVYDLPFYQE